MPTYEYRCEQGHQFEQFQRMNEAPIDRCPTCGAPAERLLSAGAGLLFKGSGFYITDYRSESYKKAAEAESGKSPDAKSGDSKSGESKSAESKSGDTGGTAAKKGDAGPKKTSKE